MCRVFHYSYDRAGRLTEIREELDNGLSAAEGDRKYAVTRYRYDENGNRTEIITPEGYRILREYDACDRLIRERTVDRANGMDRTVSVTYDYAGNIIGITRQGKGLEAWETRYDYDLKDRIIHAKDCLGPVFVYEYDKNDQLKTELLPESGSRTMPGAPQNRNSYCYNAYGSLLTRTDGAGTVQEEYRYLPDGKPALFREADGQEIVYTYGIHGQETEIHTARSRKAGKAVQSFCYDSRGRITGIKDGNENRTGYGMDGWGRVQKVQHADGGEEGYTYDFAGNITSPTDANGGVITYRYNSQGLVCEIIDQEGCSETFHYDREGRMVLHTDRNGNRVRTTYNVDGNPVLETGSNLVRLHLEKGGGETISDLYYEYDLNGNRTLKSGSCLLPDGSLAKQEVSYRYDCMDRLTDEVHHGDKTAYVYDSCGNRLKKLDKNGKEEYNYNRKNQLVSRTWDGGYAAYHYDRQGNLLEAAGTEGNTLFAYNVFNRQMAVTMPDGGRLENRYDAEGLRAGTVENGVETRFLYFNGELLSELDEAGDTISRYILGYGATAVWNRGKEGYHPCHPDEQNSTAYITGLDGEIKNSYQYDAFGNLQNRNITVRNRILYTGQQYDEITGQYYLRARFYHPAVGRFLQEDVYRGDGLNLYAYCANNPVVYYDPSGYVVQDPKAIDLGDGRYRYPDNRIRNENGRFAITGTATGSRIRYRTREGKEFKYSDPRYRPPLTEKQITKTWERAVAGSADGKVRSVPSGDIIDWEPGTPRNGIWDMGHLEEERYIKNYDKYIRMGFSDDFDENEKLFVKWYQTSEHYRPLTPNDNRRDNKIHSKLTEKELQERGIVRIDENGNEIPYDKCEPGS